MKVERNPVAVFDEVFLFMWSNFGKTKQNPKGGGHLREGAQDREPCVDGRGPEAVGHAALLHARHDGRQEPALPPATLSGQLRGGQPSPGEGPSQEQGRPCGQ